MNAYEATLATAELFEQRPESAVGIPEEEFYDRMDELVTGEWVDKASICAVGLRLYAEKYLKP